MDKKYLFWFPIIKYSYVNTRNKYSTELFQNGEEEKQRRTTCIHKSGRKEEDERIVDINRPEELDNMPEHNIDDATATAADDHNDTGRRGREQWWTPEWRHNERYSFDLYWIWIDSYSSPSS